MPLVQLLALNDTSFEDALNKLVSTLGLNELWLDAAGADSEPVEIVDVSTRKAEWILRWILDGLKERKPTNIESTVKAWRVLQLLFPYVPSSSLSRTLANASFISILEGTLLLFQDEIQTLDTVRTRLHDHSKRKRKRGSEDPVSSPNAQLLNEAGLRAQSLLSILDSVVKSLQSLMAAARDASKLVEQEHIASVFRVPVEQAIRLLGSWQKLLLLQMKVSSTPPQVTLESPVMILQFSIKATTHDEGKVATLIAQNCLCPSLDILKSQGVRGDSESNQAETSANESSVAATVKLQIERMLSLHLFQYLFRQYRAVKLQNGVSDGTLARDTLKPVETSIALLKRDDSDSEQSLGGLDRIAVLWQLIVVNTPRADHESRRISESWLRLTFALLAEFAGCPVTEQGTDVTSFHSSWILAKMLETCKRHSVKVSEEVLQVIAQEYGGLRSTHPKGISWILLSKVLDLDANVFLPGTRRKDLALQGDDLSLDELFVQSLGSVKWNALFDLSNATSFSRRRPTEQYLQKLDHFSREFSMSPSSFRENLPMALMQAYADARILPDYLKTWQRIVANNYQSIIHGTAALCVWEDRTLACALQPVLEISLSDEQIWQVVTDFGQPFANLEQIVREGYLFSSETKTSVKTEAAASLVVLEAVVAAIDSEATIRKVRRLLLILHGNLLAISSRPEVQQLDVMRRLWRALTFIQSLLKRNSLPEQSLLLTDAAMNSPCFTAAIQAINIGSSSRKLSDMDRIFCALSFVLETCKSATLIQQRESINQVARAFEDLNRPWNDRNMQNSKNAEIEDSISTEEIWIMFISVLCEHPWAFCQMDSTHRQLLFSKALESCVAEVEQQTSEISFEFSTWRSLLEGVAKVVSKVSKTEVRNEFYKAFSLPIASSKPLGALDENMKGLIPITEVLMQTEPSLIGREVRESILDAISEAFFQVDEHVVATNILTHLLGTVLHLMNVSNRKAQMCNDIEISLHLGRVVQGHESLALTLMLRALVAKLAAFDREHKLLARAYSRRMVEVVQTLQAEGQDCLFEIIILTSFSDLLDSPTSLNQLLAKEGARRLSVSSENSSRSSGNTDFAQVRTLCWYEFAAVFSKLAGKPLVVEPGLIRRFAGLIDHAPEDLRTLLAHIQSCHDPDLTESIKQSAKVLPTQSRNNDNTSVDSQLQSLRANLPFSSSSSLSNHDKLSQLSLRLALVDDVESLGLVLQGISAALRGNLSQAQVDIDNLIGALIILSGPGPAGFESKYSGQIFLKICEISASLVALYRIRLTGRLHLLVQVIQNLLGCLFVPHLYSTKSDSTIHPAWFDPHDSSVTTRHASAFARLIFGLVSPTVSSVHKRKHIGLKDELADAKAYVGNFVPQILATYCKHLLHGKMPPDIRKRFLPALWAAMQIVNDGDWRAMSAGMDEQSRAIWTQTYQEWKKLSGR